MAEIKILSKLITDLLKKYPGAGEVIKSLVEIFILYVLELIVEKEIPCPCIEGWNYCYTWAFLSGPCLVLFVISLFVNLRLFQCCWCCVLFLLAKLPTPPLIWMVIFFLDGDYLVCSEVMTNNRTVASQMCGKFKCKDRSSDTPDVLLESCRKSQGIGAIICLCSLLILPALYLIPHCIKKECKEKLRYKLELEDMREMEEARIMEEQIKTKATEKATANYETNLKSLLPWNPNGNEATDKEKEKLSKKKQESTLDLESKTAKLPDSFTQDPQHDIPTPGQNQSPSSEVDTNTMKMRNYKFKYDAIYESEKGRIINVELQDKATKAATENCKHVIPRVISFIDKPVPNPPDNEDNATSGTNPSPREDEATQ